MAYRVLEHTADLAIEVSALSLAELFVECLRALTDSMTRLDGVVARESRRVALSAPDLERLLVDWLSEAIYLHERDGLLLSAATIEISRSERGWSLQGEVRGEVFDGERHDLKTLVKAATYHQLRVRQRGKRWTARVVFDL